MGKTEERQKIATDIETLGGQLNQIRERANAAGFPFTAGLIAGAEEVLVVAFNGLTDTTRKDGDL